MLFLQLLELLSHFSSICDNGKHIESVMESMQYLDIIAKKVK